MNKLIALAAAAIVGLLVARRKTLKEDSERVKIAAKDGAVKAKDGAAKINERVRGTSDGIESLADDTVLDLADTAGAENADNIGAEIG